MAHDSHAAHVDAEHEYLNPEAGSGHEHTDANTGLIIQFAVWLAVSAILTHIGIWFVFGIFVTQRERVAPPEFPLAIGQGPRLPAGPRLQQQPASEFYQFRLQEDAVLNGYSWMDRSAGTVRIPVSEAMRLTVERGLPSRPAAEGAVATETPGLMPTDGSAGRTMERRRQ
jgi:hypothetical protein